MNATPAHYSRLIVVTHWLTALAIVIAYLLSSGSHVKDDPPLYHFAFGLSVLPLVVVRLIGRAAGGAPPMEPFRYPWLTGAAKSGHAVLYLLMIGVPITGWVAASQLGVTPWFFGLRLPALTAAVPGDHAPLGELHQIGGNLILILAGLHAAIALWHHFILRDNTLLRMRP